MSDFTEGEQLERGPMSEDLGRLKRGGKRERRMDGGGTFVGGTAVVGVGEFVSFSTLGAGLVDTDIPAKGLRSLNDGDFGALGYGEGEGLRVRLSALKAVPLNVLDDVRDRDGAGGEVIAGWGEAEV